jgi:hypothetical protein
MSFLLALKYFQKTWRFFMDEEREFIAPEWKDSAFFKWARNFCFRNQWRVATTLGDQEDCMAFCSLHYVICCQRYEATCKTPQQFMSRYKQWVEMEFNTLSSKESNNRKLMENLPKEETAIQSDADLSIKLMDGSSELKTVMKLFFDAPQEIMQILREEASSCHPKQFFKSMLKAAGIKPSRSAELAAELQRLLSAK